MRLIVTDANVFIDLDAGGLLEEMFRLSALEFAVPNVLYIEELAAGYSRLPGLGLKVLTLEPAAIEDAGNLRHRYRKASQNDLLALALARASNCPLLTGDRRLREAAVTEGLEVHGTVWLVEQLLVVALINVERAREAYDRMRQDGSRLPWDEVEEQIRRWTV